MQGSLTKKQAVDRELLKGCSAVAALLLLVVQFAAIRLADTDLTVRILVPLTIACAPIVLWIYRDRLGVVVMFVGLATNLSVILANGGLMPVERPVLARAINSDYALNYEAGAWAPQTKNVVVEEGEGNLTALRDQIVIKLIRGGVIASPGDIVVLSGLLLLVTEEVWRGKKREKRRGKSK
ncbi:MAG: DUF5317 family protein [bacterium]|nr:DUF5317 family protein [bacterium]